ncbi:MAG TPA: HD domain-containing protein [Leeuwenhoekiella sp.]|nr:HD domain-containing protein [Leeuwenhoekiella sp.]
MKELSEKQTQFVSRTADFVKKTLKNAEGGHDWFHTQRVYNNSLHIASGEKVNVFIVALGALLHDIADSKFYGGDETVGPKMAQDFLDENKIEKRISDHVIAIIKNISFKGGNTTKAFDSAELQVVQDADRLDAIGAIGIARTFNYGGFKNRKLYDPEIRPQMDMDVETYKKSTAPTINHFYEKLLLLKDRMNTETGRNLAQERHTYMESFLDQFYKEWEGNR